jgi:hypothetical protein
MNPLASDVSWAGWGPHHLTGLVKEHNISLGWARVQAEQLLVLAAVSVVAAFVWVS